jgi:hypothetical protein
MLSLLYDEHTSCNALLIALLIAATGALLQIGVGCWDVAAPYIVSLPESFFTSSYTEFFVPVSS